MSIERIGLVTHGGKEAAVSTAEDVRRWAVDHDVTCADIDVWGGDPRRSPAEEAERAGHPDLIVTVGGDGTFLRGSRVAIPLGALILGVNVGRVGFLTDVSVADVCAALDAVRSGSYQVDARMALTLRASHPLEVPEGLEGLLRYGRGPVMPCPQLRPSDPEDVGWGVPLEVFGLNDVVFEKLARDRQASVAVYIDGRQFASYSADALIVGSPTGSTAYSFAAGGPILSPMLDALIFTPVAPHMIFNRSLVLSVRQSVAVRVLERSGQVALSVDGQLTGVLDPGDWVIVHAAPQRARVARVTQCDFLTQVRTRFGLADSEAALADGGSPPDYRPRAPLPPEPAQARPSGEGQPESAPPVGHR